MVEGLDADMEASMAVLRAATVDFDGQDVDRVMVLQAAGKTGVLVGGVVYSREDQRDEALGPDLDWLDQYYPFGKTSFSGAQMAALAAPEVAGPVAAVCAKTLVLDPLPEAASLQD